MGTVEGGCHRLRGSSVAPRPLRIGFAVCSPGFHGPLVVARDYSYEEP